MPKQTVDAVRRNSMNVPPWRQRRAPLGSHSNTGPDDGDGAVEQHVAFHDAQGAISRGACVEAEMKPVSAVTARCQRRGPSAGHGNIGSDGAASMSVQQSASHEVRGEKMPRARAAVACGVVKSAIRGLRARSAIAAPASVEDGLEANGRYVSSAPSAPSASSVTAAASSPHQVWKSLRSR